METIKYHLIDFINDEFKVVAFYPYTSVVLCRFMEQSHNCKTEIDEDLDKFFSKYMEIAKKMGAQFDNKVAIELVPKYELVNVGFEKKCHLFLGKYDGKVSVGLGLYQPDSWTKKYNLYLNEKTGKLEKSEE